MTLLLLYLLMLKATVTTFNGPMSLPVLREDVVVKHHLITDRELNAAVTVARCSPGPMGIYVVSVGYFAAGVPGAIAGLLAMITPAFLVIPIMRFAGRHVDHPRVKRTLDAVVLASAGLILTSAEPLARDAIRNLLGVAVCAGTFWVLAFTRVETVWAIAAAAVAGVLGFSFGIS